MKKFILSITLLFLGICVFAQNSKYDIVYTYTSNDLARSVDMDAPFELLDKKSLSVFLVMQKNTNTSTVSIRDATGKFYNIDFTVGQTYKLGRTLSTGKWLSEYKVVKVNDDAVYFEKIKEIY